MNFRKIMVELVFWIQIQFLNFFLDENALMINVSHTMVKFIILN